MQAQGVCRRKLLVVDDEPAIVELIRAILERAGYAVMTAQDGRSALELIRRESPSAAILDINMPEMDGFSVLESLSQDPSCEMPKTLVLTARMGIGDVEKAIALGASDYLSKPFTDLALLRRVGRLLGEGVHLN
jgi:CheY-like chemotaxis protein